MMNQMAGSEWRKANKGLEKAENKKNLKEERNVSGNPKIFTSTRIFSIQYFWRQVHKSCNESKKTSIYLNFK